MEWQLTYFVTSLDKGEALSRRGTPAIGPAGPSFLLSSTEV